MHKRKISVQRPKSKPRKPVCNSCSDRNALLEVSVYLPKEQRASFQRAVPPALSRICTHALTFLPLKYG